MMLTAAVRHVIFFCCMLVALLALLVTAAHAAAPEKVTVVDPFVELHSGAGRGYPVLEIVEQGSEVEVLESRTTWYRLRTRRGTEGWASRVQMLRTLTPAGEAFHEDETTAEDFIDHRYEIGALLGDFDGSALMGLYGAWRFTPNLATELAAGQAIGRSADSLLIDVSLAGHPFPAMKYSPYAAIGTGLVQTRPSSILVGANRREDQSLSVALGVEGWVLRAFVLRLEYRQYLLLTSREEHEKLDTWKAGLAVFF